VVDEFQTVSDENLARQSQQGNLVAFEELVHRYEHRIHAFIFQTLGHDTDAREATQDTFVRAFQAINKFDASRCFASWLFTIARHKGIDCFRARIPSAGQEAGEEIDFENPAEAAARQDEAQELWRRARASLPEGQFQALWLRYAEDMDIAQIAHVLGKTQTYIKVLLFRARHTLAGKFEKTAPHPVLTTKGANL